MKVSLNWVRKYTDIKLSDEEIIQKIQTQIGAVEEIVSFGDKYKGIVIAQIVEKDDHPDADKLGIYKVKISNSDTVQVVAGDKTLEIADKVAYFAPGVRLPNNVHPEKSDGIVTKVKLKGVESNGMLASARELDINSNHEIVMRIHSDAKPGTPLSEVYELDDTVIDIENKALTNRPDCFGIIGIAREIAGIQGLKFQSPEWYLSPESNRPSFAQDADGYQLQVQNNAEVLCPRYTAVVMRNVKVKASPIWLQSLLVKSGVRPINNLVDITNYLMLLTGQPLHAFDYDSVRSRDPKGKDSAYITVRVARNGEKLTTLDGKSVELSESNLLICDSENPIGIAGVMGGIETEIHDQTRNIIIESASFDMYNIRKTSMNLGIFTEAVTRFSKGQDPNQCEAVINEAMRLVAELAGGEPVGTMYDSYPLPKQPKSVSFTLSRLNRHLGTDFSKEYVVKTLENVELKCNIVDDDNINVTAPTFRNDINIREDIHEEVGRLSGYNNIPITLPLRRTDPVEKNGNINSQSQLRKILSSLGAHEVLTYNFVGQELFKKYGQELSEAYHLRNALSPELEYMRMSILPSILEKARKNLNNGYQDFAIYEINKSHNKTESDTDGLPIERHSLGLVFTADDRVAQNSYAGSPYYQAKLYTDYLANQFGLSNLKYTLLADAEPDKLPHWCRNLLNIFDHNSAAILTFEIAGEDRTAAILGNIRDSVKKKANLPAFTAGLELNILELTKYGTSYKGYREPSRYPSITQDYCFILPSDTRYSKLVEVIELPLNKSELMYRIEPVDIYQTDEQLGLGKVQMTVSVNLQSKDSTLSNRQLSTISEKIVSAVAKSLDGELK